MVRYVRAWLALACLTSVACATAGAAEPYCRSGWWNAQCQSSCCVVQFATCCDDYCRKPCPKIPCRPSTCECDDYCRRPEPCVPRPCVTCVDDYCRKPFPKSCWPANPHARCIPYCATNCEPDAAPATPELAPPVPAAQRSRVLWIR